jgi:hypothetical protein
LNKSSILGSILDGSFDLKNKSIYNQWKNSRLVIFPVEWNLSSLFYFH